MGEGRDDATYAMGRTAAETQRLVRQADQISSVTRALFLAAGIRPGMRVLDMGTGAGDGALLAADLVGPAGRVVGVDNNPAVLATARERARAAGHGHLSFVAGDFRTCELPDNFDAVIGRYVLMYLGDPVEAVRAALRHVRPGGVAVFQEYQFTLGHFAHPPSPLLDRMGDWMRQALSRAGVEVAMGGKLHHALLDAGLVEPRISVHLDARCGAEDMGYERAAEVLRSLLPRIIEYGIATEEEVGVDTYAERLREETVRQRGVIYSPATICAWARKPT